MRTITNVVSFALAACLAVAAPAGRAQVPTDPDLVADLLTFDQDGHEILRVVATGDAPGLPRGVPSRAELWHVAGPQAAPRPLSLRVTTARDPRAVTSFTRGARLDLTCAQSLAPSDWRPWSPEQNVRGVLYRAPDPDGVDRAVGLYLEYDTAGRLTAASWYRVSVRADGAAFGRLARDMAFSPVTDAYGRPSVDPRDIAAGAWHASAVLPVP
jgi:hypothetical protein